LGHFFLLEVYVTIVGKNEICYCDRVKIKLRLER
jgi:hypothetical protein